MRLGVCYYPEQWPEQRWQVDLTMMRDAGLELVRIGEFAWARYEPARDQWDWGWLDRVLELARDAGLEVVLGTPTATPPPPASTSPADSPCCRSGCASRSAMT